MAEKTAAARSASPKPAAPKPAPKDDGVETKGKLVDYLPRMSPNQAWWLSHIIPVGYAIYGKLRYGDEWLKVCFALFLVLEFVFFLATAGLVQVAGRAFGDRCQKVPEDKDKFWDEFLESTRCMYMVACMGSAPLVHYNQGIPTGLKWELPITPLQYAGVFLVGVIVTDGWTYLKHRLLHYKPLYAIHKHHHTFPNPSVLAGFAIHPIETIWTFAPVYLWDYPFMCYYIPVFVPSVLAFFVLNAYLHCGYTIGIFETILPRFFINTSAFHNMHHEKTNTHFGEVSSLWDYLLGTAKIYDNGLQAGYQWHVDAGKGARHWRVKSQ